MNLFQISPNDQSIYYLGRIFGNVGNVLSGTGPMMLGEMFRAFNSVLLGFAALIIVYTTIVGLINTAAQGEFLGNKWNKVWTPVRMVAGILSLFPLPGSGYCLIQVIMMWFIMQGVGAADTVWSATVDYLLKGGAVQTPPGRYGDSNGDSIKKIYDGLVCQAAIEQLYCTTDTVSKEDKVWCQSSHDFSAADATTLLSKPYKMGPASNKGGGVCGTLSLDTTKTPKAVQLAQIQSYASIIPTLQKIANEQVRRVNAYMTYKAGGQVPVKNQWWLTVDPEKQVDPTCNEKSCNPELGQLYAEYAINPYVGSNFVRDTANLYTGYVANAATQSSHARNAVEETAEAMATMRSWETLDQAKARVSRQNEQAMRKELEKSKINGWAFAGGYYYLIASMNNTVIDASLTQMNVTVKELAKGGGGDPWFDHLPEEEDSDKKIYTKVLTQFYSARATTKAITNEQGKGGGEGEFGSGVGDGISSLGQALVKGWMYTLSSGDVGKDEAAVNPMIKLQSFGRWILGTIQIAYIAFLAVLIVTVGTSSTCAAVQGFGFGVSAGYTYILAPVLGFMGAMFVFAGMLSVYMPMIPYILFTFGVIGWLIAAIETMVAAPIVAIGVMLPEGGHEVWGHAAPAGKIVFNIVLRPTLMIFGMMSGMLLSYVVVTFINAAFLGVMNQVGAPGVVEVVLFMGIYTTILMSALNKCFSLIHVVPDKVLRFIGGGSEQFGESEALGEAKKGTESAAGDVKGGGSGAMGKVSEHGSARGKQKEKKQEDEHKQQLLIATQSKKDEKPSK